MIEKMIIDADLCIKIGASDKYMFLYELLPVIANRIYMHTHTFDEVLAPLSAVRQLRKLVLENKVKVVSEENLGEVDKAIYEATYKKLARVMINPNKPNKNKGEVCSLAYAKATRIPVFATDEKNLQPIIDTQLNTGIDNITCIRIVDIIIKAKNGEINIPRKQAKALWRLSGKQNETFDMEIWPIKQI